MAITLVSKGKKITLNQQQEEGVVKIKEFLKSNKNFFTLAGPAGTGKTTIINAAIENERHVGVAAPTHQAKREIQNATGRDGVTIQSILGLKPATDLEEFSQNNTLFKMVGEGEKMGDYRVLVIDESSMINSELFNALKKSAIKCGTKIIFMGDENQLPPVKESKAMAFCDTSIEKHFLSIVERQSFGNPLIDIYGKILSDIKSPIDLYKKETNMIENLGYSFYAKPYDFVDVIKERFGPDSKEDNKILSWTNENVRKWNNLVRNFNPSLEGTLVVENEVLKAYRTVFEYGGKKTIFENSQDYTVIDITPHNLRIGEYTYTGIQIEIEPKTDGSCSVVFCPAGEDSIRSFVAEEQRLSAKALKAKDKAERAQMWAIYYGFRDRFCIIGDILDSSRKILVRKDLDYNYSMTVHKSQGTTVDNVFIDMNNIGKFWDGGMSDEEINATRNRLKYVALSRPRFSAHIFQS